MATYQKNQHSGAVALPQKTTVAKLMQQWKRHSISPHVLVIYIPPWPVNDHRPTLSTPISTNYGVQLEYTHTYQFYCKSNEVDLGLHY